MARPARKRGFRRIVVDDKSFYWCFDSKLLVFQESESSKRGQRLVVDWRWIDWLEPEFNDTPDAEPLVVTPKYVAGAIEFALNNGWQPVQAGTDFCITLKNGEFALP